MYDHDETAITLNEPFLDFYREGKFPHSIEYTQLLYQKDQLKQKTASEEEESEGSEHHLTGLGNIT